MNMDITVSANIQLQPLGQSRDSMQSFIIRSLQVVFVMAIAQGTAIFGADLIDSINAVKDTVSLYVTGKQYKSPERMIDATLLAMNVLQERLAVYSQNGSIQKSVSFVKL